MAFFRKTFPTAVAAAASLILAVTLPGADAPFTPEVQQRLDLLKAGYETFVLNNTTIPYESGLKALNERVKPTLEREGAAAAQRTDLDTLVRIKADLKRLEEGEVLTAVDEPPPAALRHAYSAYKLELSRLEAAQKASLADAKRRYDKGLDLVQRELTKAQDVTAALEVKQMREALAEAPAPSTTEITGQGAGATAGASSAMDPESTAGANLLRNGTFEKGLDAWEFTTWNREVESKTEMDKKVLYRDRPTLRVTSPSLNDVHIAQKVKVKPGTRYLMSGFIKAQEIKDAKGNTDGIPGVKVQGGGCLSAAGKGRYATSFVSTDTWTEVSREFKTQDETEVVFECRLGYFSAPVSGTAWFADVSLTELPDTAPQAAGGGTPAKPAAAEGKSLAEVVRALGGTYISSTDGDEVTFTSKNLTTADLLQIGAFKRLKTFTWNGGTGLTDEGLAAFAGMKKLTGLFLWSTGRITDAGLRHLADCEKLESLNIGANGEGVTGTGFESLGQCKSLKTLTLNLLPGIEGRHLRFLTGLKSFENLRLSGCAHITDADMEWIGQMTSLKYLHVGRTGVTNAGMAKLTGLRHLEELTVTSPMVTSEGLAPLKKARPSLVVIFTK